MQAVYFCQLRAHIWTKQPSISPIIKVVLSELIVCSRGVWEKMLVLILCLTTIYFSLPPSHAAEAILPIPAVTTEKWRMIHFKHKKKRSMMHVLDGYDITQPSSKQQHVREIEQG